MDESQYLVQKNSAGKVKYHLLELRDNTITQTWGLVGGKTQTKTNQYKAINAGKANELTPARAAAADFNRIINKKVKEGYVLTDSLDELPEFTDPLLDIDLDHIPTQFCLSKPTKDISVKALDKLIASGNARFFVKYNGGCHFIVIGSDSKAKIFTRRWDDHTTKYPKVAKAAEAKGYPPKTVLVVELCVDPLLGLDHMMAFKAFGSIAKSNTTKGVCKEDQSKALALQEEYPIRAAVFGILYSDGTQTWHWPYADILKGILASVKGISAKEVLFVPQEAGFTSGQQAYDMAKLHKAKIEGFVVWDLTKAMEVTMNGKPLRRAAWKVKARGEMDVIATSGLEGKVAGQFGSINIGQYDAKGEFIPMGSVGGLKDDECDPGYWTFPCVIEVSYDNIFPDTGLLQFGNFVKVHEDKQIEEVELFSLA